MSAGILDGRDFAAGEDANAVRLHFHADVVAELVIETAQNIFAAIDKRHVRAQPGKDSGKFHGNVTAALNQYAPREVRQMERLVRRNDVIDAGDWVAVAWRRAG